jgi:hypothetical protein
MCSSHKSAMYPLYTREINEQMIYVSMQQDAVI